MGRVQGEIDIRDKQSSSRRTSLPSLHESITKKQSHQAQEIAEFVITMGSKVNILRVNLDISDLDRNYYQEHKFTIGHQPPETGIYIIARILAFTLNAHERLVYTKGTDTRHEPAIWQKDLTDDIELWIEIGEPDEKRTRKACARSKHVIIYTYKEGSSGIWWKLKSPKFNLFKNLSVISLPAQALEDLASMINRTMELQCTIQDRHVWIGNKGRTVEFDPIIWKEQEG